jgi:hypothetical protein
VALEDGSLSGAGRLLLYNLLHPRLMNLRRCAVGNSTLATSAPKFALAAIGSLCAAVRARALRLRSTLGAS